MCLKIDALKTTLLRPRINKGGEAIIGYETIGQMDSFTSLNNNIIKSSIPSLLLSGQYPRNTSGQYPRGVHTSGQVSHQLPQDAGVCYVIGFALIHQRMFSKRSMYLLLNSFFLKNLREPGEKP